MHCSLDLNMYFLLLPSLQTFNFSISWDLFSIKSIISWLLDEDTMVADMEMMVIQSVPMVIDFKQGLVPKRYFHARPHAKKAR